MAKKCKPKKEWTPNGYIFAALRRIFRWSPERRAVLNAASNGKKGKAERYSCSSCTIQFPKKDIAVDHINPVVDPRLGFSGWNDYVTRLFCTRQGLQVLCKARCHAGKTKAENVLRREVKKGLINGKN